MILMHHENALSYYLKESQFNGNHSLFKASHISELKLCGTFSRAKLSQSLLMLQRSSPDVTSPWQAAQGTIRAWLIAPSWSEFRTVWSKDSPLLCSPLFPHRGVSRYWPQRSGATDWICNDEATNLFIVCPASALTSSPGQSVVFNKTNGEFIGYNDIASRQPAHTHQSSFISKLSLCLRTKCLYCWGLFWCFIRQEVLSKVCLTQLRHIWPQSKPRRLSIALQS